MDIISKDEAKSLGLKRFYTGMKCGKGHDSEKLVSNNCCVECQRVNRLENKEKNKAYKAEYYQKNKTEIASDRKVRYEENKDVVAAKGKLYRDKNHKEIAIRKKEYYNNNRDEILARRKATYDPIKNKIQCEKYRANNKDKMREASKLYRAKNADQIRISKAKYFQENKDRIVTNNRVNNNKRRDEYLKYHREYSARNSHIRSAYKVRNKDRITEYKKQYKKDNPLLTFTRNTLTRIESSTGIKRQLKYAGLLGYTQKEFIDHIESKFLDGMSWSNRNEWHVDHIKPLKLFIDEGVTDVKIINALCNLQPLWAKDNLIKGAKYTP